MFFDLKNNNKVAPAKEKINFHSYTLMKTLNNLAN